MSTIFLVLLGAAMLAVLATLFMGLFAMARGGTGTGAKQNKLMQMRVGFQALALVLFVLALISSQA
ncbi:twin transmembrane helix small protein [Elstera cyanobacteriorum]|uniref:HIG1 domain-containing protein n=1 Tax=Elstera cyanobacteriorum TaxID=2022747 RepID=A0A255XLF2_9PROT|nr:twin transmembrane helix small protein [Elstera cyanobacteriorum]MCK6441540.1 twin transmembrane helix small protein [Elstera cyanobacteriorum]OYQ17803.1 hypothetical protein CHR90_12545 [Elstera cyanobacteriorum]GFZ85977.1 hypothetical protein GCM10011497_14060 [Elstera cyanobacteriorum]